MNSFRSVCVAFVLLVCPHAMSLPSSVLAVPQDHSVSQRALLGIDGTDNGPDNGGWGVLVSRVYSGSGADEAGILVGDRLLGIADEVTETLAAVRAILAKHSAGDCVQVVTRRAQALRIVDVTLVEQVIQPSLLQQVLDVLQVKRGQAVADIGFGTGWITKGLSSEVGSTGRVFAVEISERRVRNLKEQGLENVTCVLSQADDILLEQDSLDLALLHDVASHVQKSARLKFYESVARALKPTAELVVFGPHGEAQAMLKELAGYGFHAREAEELAQLSAGQLDLRLKRGLRFIYRAEK